MCIHSYCQHLTLLFGAGMGDSHQYGIMNRINPAVLPKKGSRVFGKVTIF
jgi:hypothetical protein